MKFKYYLRGAGIGVIVSTVILSVTFLFHDNMSDAEVIQRAMELGMVMEEGTKGTLADIPQQGNTKTDQEQPDDNQQADTQAEDRQEGTNDTQTSADQEQDEPKNPDQNSSDVQTGDNSDDSEKEPANQPDPASNQDEQPDEPSKPNTEDDEPPSQEDNHAQGRKVTITIVGGDVSRMVSQKVQEAGLVDDAEEFNDYLGSHNYANFLQPGTYEIKKGSNFRQIAEILTNK